MRHDTSRAAGRPSPSRSMRPTSKSPTAAETRDFFSSLLGRIGGRLAGLAKAFGMEVIGVRRDPAAGANGADAVHHFDRLSELLPRADFVALTCPLTPETQGIIGADALSRMKSSVVLVNCARGKCVDEPALVDALQRGEIVAAALDVPRSHSRQTRRFGRCRTCSSH